MKKILITGGCGFVGTNLVEYLLSAGSFELTLLDNFSNAVSLGIPSDFPMTSNIRIVQGDIRSRTTCDDAVAGQDVVVHLAAYTQVMESLRNPAPCYETNVQGTINLLEACREYQVRRFVFASSNAAVGDHNSAVSERSLPAPLSPYGATKLTGEALCSAYCHSYGIEAVALRFSNAYGPHCQRKSSVIARFMRDILNGTPLTIYGDGRQSRDFVHVMDLCQAIHLCVASGTKVKPTTAGEVFQIASGRETTLLGLVRILRRVTGVKPQIEFEKARPGEIARNASDLSKSRSKLKFAPKINLEDGLTQLHRWFCHNYTANTGSAPMLS